MNFMLFKKESVALYTRQVRGKIRLLSKHIWFYESIIKLYCFYPCPFLAFFLFHCAKAM